MEALASGIASYGTAGRRPCLDELGHPRVPVTEDAAEKEEVALRLQEVAGERVATTEPSTRRLKWRAGAQERARLAV